MSGFGFRSSKPDDLTPFAQRVFATLAKYTAFPWPIMLAQCRRVGVDPAALTPEDLAKVIEPLAEGIGRFTSPEKAAAVEHELRQLAG